MDHGQYLVHSSKSSLFEEGIMVLMTIEMTIHVHCIIKKNNDSDNQHVYQ